MKKSEILLSLAKAIIEGEEKLAKITSTFGVLDHPHFLKAYRAAIAEGRSKEEAMAVGIKAYKVATNFGVKAPPASSVPVKAGS